MVSGPDILRMVQEFGSTADIEDVTNSLTVNGILKAFFPKNFNKFLAVDENKEQLFNLIAKCLVLRIKDDQVLICTVGDVACASNMEVDMSSISPCNANEAGERLLLHADKTVQSGLHHVTIRTIDSYASYAFNIMSGNQTLWIDFGVGRHRRMIPIHELSTNMPTPMAYNYTQ